jgi:hypothetical protein
VTDTACRRGVTQGLLADGGEQPGGERALDTLFRSAESYLPMWEAADD